MISFHRWMLETLDIIRQLVYAEKGKAPKPVYEEGNAYVMGKGRLTVLRPINRPQYPNLIAVVRFQPFKVHGVRFDNLYVSIHAITNTYVGKPVTHEVQVVEAATEPDPHSQAPLGNILWDVQIDLQNGFTRRDQEVLTYARTLVREAINSWPAVVPDWEQCSAIALTENGIRERVEVSREEERIIYVRQYDADAPKVGVIRLKNNSNPNKPQ